MRSFKSWALRMLLSKNERVVIWDSLTYSHHTYTRRKDTQNALRVQAVMNSLKDYGMKEERYTPKEIDEIIGHVIAQSDKNNEVYKESAVKKAFKQGYQTAVVKHSMQDWNPTILDHFEGFGGMQVFSGSQREFAEAMKAITKEVQKGGRRSAIIRVVKGEKPATDQSTAKPATKDKDIKVDFGSGESKTVVTKVDKFASDKIDNESYNRGYDNCAKEMFSKEDIDDSYQKGHDDCCEAARRSREMLEEGELAGINPTISTGMIGSYVPAVSTVSERTLKVTNLDEEGITKLEKLNNARVGSLEIDKDSVKDGNLTPKVTNSNESGEKETRDVYKMAKEKEAFQKNQKRAEKAEDDGVPYE